MWVDSLESEKEKPGKGEKVRLSLTYSLSVLFGVPLAFLTIKVLL